MGKINLKLSANVKSKTNFIKLIQWQKWARKEKKMPLSKERKYLMILAEWCRVFSLKGLENQHDFDQLMKQINFQMYLLAFSVFMDNNHILWKRAESYKHSSRYLTNIDSMHAPTNDSILVENIDKCNYFWICIAYSSIFNDSWKKK